MNILIEGGDLNPPFAEGTRNIAITHALELKHRGHNVIIFTKNKDKILNKIHPKFEVIDGIKFYRWSNYFNLFFKYREILKKEKINLVHIFAKGTRPSYYINFLKKFGGRKIPVVFSLLGYPGINYQSLSISDKVFIPSKTIYEKLKLKNSIYIPYGIDFKKFLMGKKNRNIILDLRFPSYSFLSAFKKMSSEKKGLKLLLHKKNLDNRKEIRDYVANLKIKNINEIAYVNKMRDLFQNAKILVDTHFDRDLETRKFLKCASPPLLVLEAMASGVIVISNNIPEIKEIIIDNKTGILVKEDNEKEFYNSLKKALNNPEIGINARKEVGKKFDIRKTIIKYEKIYRELCEFH